MRWQHFCRARPPLKLCRTHFDPARGGMFKQIGLIALQCAAFWGFIFDLLRPFAVKPHALDTCGQYPCMGWKVAPLLPDYCHQKIGLWNFYWWIDIHGISRSKLSHVLSYIYIYKYLTRPQKQYTCVLSHAGSVTSPTKNYVLQDAIEDVSSGVTGLQKATLFHANLSSLMFLAPEDLKSK